MSDIPTPLDYTDLDGLLVWSRAKMQLPPDFVIGDPDKPYMRRWWIVPRNRGSNVYLHEILRSDDDRALHDHPWDNQTLVIDGGYIEHTPEGVFDRKPGDFVTRVATSAHRLEIPEGGRAVSLFTTGPNVREWGFHCPTGWRHWRDFTGGAHGELIGRGCS